MALLASDIINDAIAMAYPYVWEPGVNTQQLLRVLTVLDEDVVQLYSNQFPERLDQVATITVVQSQNATGYALQSSPVDTYGNFNWIDSQGITWPINIVTASRFDHPGEHPAGIVRASTFFPCDPQEIGWTQPAQPRNFFIGNGDTIQYRYLLTATRITSLSQNLASPDEHRDFFTTNLALNILLNASGDPRQPIPPEVLQMAVQRASQQKQDLLLGMMKRSDTQARGMEQR
jgi:hypothetical protein